MIDEGREPAVFVDRDGTICVDRHDQEGNRVPEFFPTVIDGLKILNHTGLPVFIITTDTDKGVSQFTEDEIGELHDQLLSLLSDNGIRIKDIFYCPHPPCDGEGGNNGHRTASQMLVEASDKHLIDLARSIVIGDRIEDIEVAKEIGARSILIPEPGTTKEKVEVQDTAIKPDFVARNFMEAAFWLMRKVGH